MTQVTAASRLWRPAVFFIGAMGMGMQLQMPAVAQPLVEATPSTSEVQTVDYPSGFFSRYNPDTALDMVRQLPGFQLDDGSGERGFGAAVGNIMINGRRPSAKEDAPSSILGRIPASQVAHIELIRGYRQGVDMRGQTVMANIVLREDIPATIRWETAVRKNLDIDQWMVRGNVSMADRWQGMDFNTGISAERSATGEKSLEDRFDGNNLLTEQRDEVSTELGHKLGANLNAGGWAGNTLLQLNTAIKHTAEQEPVPSIRTPRNPDGAPHIENFYADREELELEVGMNAERDLAPQLAGKGILLWIIDQYDEIESQQSLNTVGLQTRFRESDADTDETEMIARAEFDWTGWTDHSLQLDLEAAYNELVGELTQIVDNGTGAVVVDVPGANSTVEELRGDFLLKDTWSLGRFELDYGLGAETSTIKQSGDAELERDFFFVKPHAVLSYSAGGGRQTRLRLAREVAQLDFDDFISATVYEDDDLALGNPNLRPDTTWIAEAGQEWRYGELGVVKVTLFHHWIRDVLDLLPLSETFESPGNIGEGKRWGVELENTVPLEWLGLSGARLDMKLRWQDSSVTDPVTGETRELTAVGGFNGPPDIRFRNDNRYVVDVSYRQDFDAKKFAWGWRVAEQAQRSLYKVNELEINNEGVLVNLFAETTRWFGLKLCVDGINLLNYDEVRDRVLIAGARDLSAVESRIIRERSSGRRLNISVSGSF